ncbi:tetratricopeptide repeat protein [Vibrio alfacsensis]|uniref:tetratricopeptide repeat protein n=1 Tax=Vibrio alfacsensis TaxID=1074311 RepID=UPI0040697DFB
MDKSQFQLETELNKVKGQIKADPERAFRIAEQCLIRAEQILFIDGEIKALIIMAHSCWCQMDYRQGLKLVKGAHRKQTHLDNDDHLPEILHLFALQYWGLAKYYSAQQYWINALEKSALVDDIETQIEALIGLGNVWRITNEHQLAASTHELAVKVANNVRIAWLEGKARILLAWDYYLLNNFAEMLTVLDGATETLKDHTDCTWQAEIWDFRGLALLGLGRLDAAEEATEKAHQLAIEQNLSWMKAHSSISRARLELLRKNTQGAVKLLEAAEESALSFDNGELLSQIFFQQSRVAEEQGEYEVAFKAFQKYRQHAIKMLKEQAHRETMDKAHGSKRQLELRAKKQINRIRVQHEYDPEKQFSNVVSETYWWEQLVLFKTELKHSNHAVIMIQHHNPAVLDACTELVHSLAMPSDLISRISSTRLALLIAEKDQAAQELYRTVCSMMDIYPWKRRGFVTVKPTLYLQDILTFPFTLEQLEESHIEVMKNGTTAQ